MSARSPLAPMRGPDERTAQEEPVLSVAELDARLRSAVRGVGASWVEGEVSGCKGASAQGHVYFTLKDEREDACIACAMFRREALQAGGERLVNGARVRVRGSADLYSPRGSLQLIVTRVLPAGQGDLLARREELKRKLAAEGLFDASRKRALPADPRVIGVVTSAGGAVFSDICKVAARRGRVRILLSPASVQGDDAPRQLRNALARLAAVRAVDVIVIGRGGGSAEDLAAFDDEGLARAIAACGKPVVAAVGHEVDWSIACLVADVRAATPSQAAELIVPDLAARLARISEATRRLGLAMKGRLRGDHAVVARALTRLRAPERILAQQRQRLDELLTRAATATRARVREQTRLRNQLQRRLEGRHPAAVIAQARGALMRDEQVLRAAIARAISAARGASDPLLPRAIRAMRALMERRRASISASAQKLDAISPLAVLGRGYSIALLRDARAPDERTTRVLRDASDAAVGDAIELRLHRGRLEAQVTAVHPGEARRDDERGARGEREPRDEGDPARRRVRE